MNQEDFLSQEEATRLWRRAAKIQAEAARQAEMDAAREVTRELDAEQAARSAEGYALTHVRAAAVEAGIGAEFVDAALSDIRAERALGGSGGARLARRLLGNPDEALAVSRVINAPVEEVLEAMESVMPGEPFGLTLRDRRGDPASGGLLIFDIPGASLLGAQQPGFLGQASYADLREIYASLRTLGDASCELTLRSPVAWAFALNALIATVATGTGGGIGFGIGTAFAGLVGVGAGAPILAAAVLVSAVGTGAGTTHFLFRKLYQHAMGRGRTALESLLGAIALEAEGGWGFSTKALPEGPGE